MTLVAAVILAGQLGLGVSLLITARRWVRRAQLAERLIRR